MSTLPPCNHTRTVLWFSNTGNAWDDSPEGTPMAIKSEIGNVLSLTLCKDCGRTFISSARDRKARTAATLRELEKIANG